MRCTAKSKQRQDQCRLSAVPGRTVCKFHGGKIPRGPALPQFKNGKYSKFLPSRMLQRYRDAEADPELTSLRSELSLIDARLVDLLRRVDTGESGEIWEALQKEWADFRLNRRLQDVPKMHENIAKMDQLFARRLTDHA